MKKYGAPSVKKAFEILGAVSASSEGLGVSEIARDLTMAKSTVHGMTSALEQVGAVMRDPLTKRYRLGFTLFELGRSAYSQINLTGLARPVMEALMESTEASVFLGILNWDHVTVLDVVESRQDLKITAPIGTVIPLLAGAVGKVFLAYMDEEKTADILQSKGLPRFTENAITDIEAYYKELAEVRKKGYAVDDEEYILGVRAVAAPILGLGQLKSAIWVVGFKASLDKDKMKALIHETRKSAEAISRGIQNRS